MTNTSKVLRPDMYRFHNGEKGQTLPFDAAEYEARLEEPARQRMTESAGVTAAIFTSMHNRSPITAGFLYCAFGQALWVWSSQHTDCVTISAQVSTRASRGGAALPITSPTPTGSAITTGVL